MIVVNTTECSAALFANSSFLAPNALAINEFAPAPIPFPSPTIIINNGVIKPSAARASAPSPDTHTLSAKL